MKITHLLPILLLLMPEIIFGQLFADPSSAWLYNYIGNTGYGVTQIRPVKDTLIAGENVDVLERQAVRVSFSNRLDTFRFRLPSYYLLEKDDGLILFSINAIDFDTLYFFGGDVGEEWELSRRRGNTRDTIKISIEDKVTYHIEGQELEAQALKYVYSTGGIVHDTALVGIGTIAKYIDPFDLIDLEFDAGEGGRVRCYSSDNTGSITFPLDGDSAFEVNCSDLISSGTDFRGIDNYLLSIYPNPAGNSLMILDQKIRRSKYFIMSILGRVVRSGSLSENDISLDGLKSGQYVLIVEGVGRTRFTKL